MNIATPTPMGATSEAVARIIASHITTGTLADLLATLERPDDMTTENLADTVVRTVALHHADVDCTFLDVCWAITSKAITSGAYAKAVGAIIAVGRAS